MVFPRSIDSVIYENFENFSVALPMYGNRICLFPLELLSVSVGGRP